jgi:hypothetical protein
MVRPEPSDADYDTAMALDLIEGRILALADELAALSPKVRLVRYYVAHEALRAVAYDVALASDAIMGRDTLARGAS